MAQKPYKHNIEYIQKFYSYGSEAKVLELKPVYQEDSKTKSPKHEKEPVKTLCIDPIAFCSLMLAVVMAVTMVVGFIQVGVACQDHAVMKNYLNELREENVLLTHQYTAGYDLETVDTTARALGMIPIEDAKTISIRVQVPEAPQEPNFIDNMIWFLTGLFA